MQNLKSFNQKQYLKFFFYPLIALLIFTFLLTFYVGYSRSNELEKNLITSSTNLTNELIMSGDIQRLNSQVKSLREIVGAKNIYLLSENRRVLSHAGDTSIHSTGKLLLKCNYEYELKFTDRLIGYYCWEKNLLSPFNFYLYSLLLIFLVVTISILVLAKYFAKMYNNIFTNIEILISGFKKNQDFSSNQTFNIAELDTLKELILKYNRLKNLESNELLLSKISRQISHDIKSPITALNLLSEKLTVEKNLFKSAIDRIEGIVADLNQKNKYLDFSDQRSILEDLKHVIDEKKLIFPFIELIIKSSSNPVMLDKIKSIEIQRVFSNILNNAIEALLNTNTPHIIIKFIATDSKTVIIFEDNGKGIPPDILPHIFEENLSYDKKDGSGIGLFHAKQKISRLGGIITVESNIGCTRFTVTLPKKIHD